MITNQWIRKKLSHYKTVMFALLVNGQKHYFSPYLGVHFRLQLKYFIDFIIYRNGVFQKDIIESTKTILSRYNIGLYVDVGSHIGQMSLFIGKNFSQVKVMSIEPVPSNAERQKANMVLNNLSYDILPYALSDQKSSINLYQPGKRYFKEYFRVNDGRWSILPANDKSLNSAFEVSTTTLDAIMIDHDENKRILIKLDVEGHELEVIKGGLKTLTKYKIILIIELMMTVEFDRCKKVIDILQANHYQMFDLKLRPLKSEDINVNMDVIFMN